ncbi:hypothetical protein A2957_03090 [Candidatus Roizmanbacteria bacterium RIFCSPLOWO2_01_FULL_38_11]|uniref:SGNH hydrolase-type esterase domain-containing protein n=1 Tax=Candidatus Roizmanbacteria bacterium RIFCSPLOWO2_01_FULL_38_11 TaxID=1802060 RepID=A0A1F7ILM1_9BACT|nr:MAG: hypothetical protein A2957_03090 [Candidatus Roizmanbacteria bacterium RIFCSPLOWO2_01_FULL_38_11]
MDNQQSLKKTIRKHVGILVGQASILVLLAIVYIGYEFKATLYERAIPREIASAVVTEDADASAVLGSETSDATIEPVTPSPEITFPIFDLTQQEAPTPFPTEIAYPQPPKSEYKIVVFGDSMEDTQGERLEYFEHELTKRYPSTSFKLYNFGVGSQNVEEGFARFHRPLVYQDRNYPSIDDINPDIIIIGSFAYNVFTPHDRNKHWITLTQLVQEAQQLTPNVYMLAEIAPRRRGFGFGPNGVNWEPNTAFEHTGKIIEQLENALGLSRTLNVPLIDVYSASLLPDRKEGDVKYINPSDNIHPSVEGHLFMAKVIVDSIDFQKVR